jgi:hypothetical protein
VAARFLAAKRSLAVASATVAASASVRLGPLPLSGTSTPHHRGRGVPGVPAVRHAAGLGMQYVPGGPTAWLSLHTNCTLGASLQLRLPSPLSGCPGCDNTSAREVRVASRAQAQDGSRQGWGGSCSPRGTASPSPVSEIRAAGSDPAA